MSQISRRQLKMMEMMEIVDEHHIEIYLCRRCKISCLFCLVLFVFLNTRVYKNTHSYVKVICLSVLCTLTFIILYIFLIFTYIIYLFYIKMNYILYIYTFFILFQKKSFLHLKRYRYISRSSLNLVFPFVNCISIYLTKV